MFPGSLSLLSTDYLFVINRDNIALGVRAGMVRSSIDCKAGLDAFKEKYPQIAKRNSSIGVLDEWYVSLFLQPQYLARLYSGVNTRWKDEHSGQTVDEGIREALVKGFGEPVLNLIHFLEYEHSRHCLPTEVASGLANLPVDFVYTDGVPDLGNRTTKILPGSGRELNGTETYRMILSYFTTFDISPQRIYEEGIQQLNVFMPKVKVITLP